jgi:hypothetical protein
MDLLRKIKSLGCLREGKGSGTRREVALAVSSWDTPRPIDLRWPDLLLKRHQNIQKLKEEATTRMKNTTITTLKEQMEQVDELEGLIDIMLEEYWGEPLYRTGKGKSEVS